VSVATQQKTTEGTSLRRVIGPKLLMLFVLGDILGAGIYALVGEVAGEVGGAVWSSFLVAFILALLTAFAYAELVTKYPQAAGAALYAHKAFRSNFLTFLVTFGVMASGVASVGASARAFGGDYFRQFVDVPTVTVAVLFVLALSAINFIGIRESVKANVAMTLLELGGLIVILVIGFAALAGGDAEPARSFEFKDGSIPLLVLSGATLAFYALLGFEDSVNVAEETRDPQHAYPRALFGGMIIAAIVYLLVTFVASAVVPTTRLADSSAPLLEVVRLGPGNVPPKLFSAVALVAVSNTALLNLIMASRLLYGMARQGVLPRGFALVHSARRTPWVAILFTMLLSLALATTGQVETLADTTVILLLGAFIVVNIAVLVLKRDRVDHDHFTSPRAIPVLAAVICIALLTQQEAEIWARAGLLMLVGLLLWGLNRLLGRRAGPLRAEELRG
jgi:basic amino acid/polyamine antiporter, APA family